MQRLEKMKRYDTKKNCFYDTLLSPHKQKLSACKHRIPGFFSRWFQAPLAGIRTTVLRGRNYPADQSFIVVCNHQSIFDSLAMMEAFPDNCAVIVKKTWLFISPFGLAAALSGAIFVERGTKNNMDVLQKVVDNIHKKKCRVWFFPEGTRKLSGKNIHVEEPMLPFKMGAFNIAVLAQIPVVPVVFSSQDKFFSYADKMFKPGRIVASILPPISTSSLTLEDVPRLTDKVRTMMIEEFKRISE
eukprot:XP_011666836.1 PREDICTED: 1-acyl-sn-glycerol-3-phosphate acyltransferase alpha-like isoform X2 [Strongylocentrotus purpuratus]